MISVPPLVSPSLLAEERKVLLEKYSDFSSHSPASPASSLPNLQVLTGAVERPEAGSCLVFLGQTKVLCIVEGPIPSPKYRQNADEGHLYITTEFTPFAKPNLHRSNQTAAHWNKNDLTVECIRVSNSVRAALLPFLLLKNIPRMDVRIFIKVLDNGGDIESAALMAASNAWIQRGLDIQDTLVACSLQYWKTPSGDVRWSFNQDFKDLLADDDEDAPLHSTQLFAVYSTNLQKFSQFNMGPSLNYLEAKHILGLSNNNLNPSESFFLKELNRRSAICRKSLIDYHQRLKANIK